MLRGGPILDFVLGQGHDVNFVLTVFNLFFILLLLQLHLQGIEFAVTLGGEFLVGALLNDLAIFEYKHLGVRIDINIIIKPLHKNNTHTHTQTLTLK